MSTTEETSIFDEVTVDEPAVDENIYHSEETPPYDTPSAEQKPNFKLKPRIPGDEVLGMVYGGIGTLLVSKKIDVPVGRYMRFQAPLVGMRIDSWLRDTIVDKMIVQPLARLNEQGDDAKAVLAGPMLVFFLERAKNEAQQNFLLGQLHDIVFDSLLDLAPFLKKKAAKEQRAAKNLQDLGELDFDLPPGVNPVDAIINGLFAPLEETPNMNGSATEEQT